MKIFYGVWRFTTINCKRVYKYYEKAGPAEPITNHLIDCGRAVGGVLPALPAVINQAPPALRHYIPYVRSFGNNLRNWASSIFSRPYSVYDNAGNINSSSISSGISGSNAYPSGYISNNGGLYTDGGSNRFIFPNTNSDTISVPSVFPPETTTTTTTTTTTVTNIMEPSSLSLLITVIIILLLYGVAKFLYERSKGK